MRGKWLLFLVLAVAAGIGEGAISMRGRHAPPPVQARGTSAALITTKDITLNGANEEQNCCNRKNC